jgi:hypothetical protein
MSVRRSKPKIDPTREARYPSTMEFRIFHFSFFIFHSTSISSTDPLSPSKVVIQQVLLPHFHLRSQAFLPRGAYRLSSSCPAWMSVRRSKPKIDPTREAR